MKQTKVLSVKHLASISHHARTTVLLSVCILQTVLGLSVQAQGTAFTYQGRLDSGGAPTDGIYDLRFALYDSASAGSLIRGPLTNAATAVSNGLFTVVLDFGTGVFTGSDRWLEIGVRTNGSGGFTSLSPRQQLTATPYAMIAGNVSGVIANASLPTSPSFSGTVSAGGFTGSGTGLTNLNASQLTTGTVPLARLPASVTQLGQSIESAEITDGTIQAGDLDGPSFNEYFWGIAGNTLGGASGTPFLGTRDNAPLDFRVNNQRALRIEPNAANAPNIIGGYAGNIVSNGMHGAFIGGGGHSTGRNRVGGNYASVLGGYGNTAGGAVSTAMGAGTTASGDHSTAMGQGARASGYIATAMGEWTIASGNYSTAMGSSTEASGDCSTALGSRTEASGEFSFAAGRLAQANHDGAFVWADSEYAYFSSTTTNQFSLRASGGVRLSDSTPSISFGATTRQMLDLYNQDYGVGVQVSTLYQRSNSRFSWFRGGVHSNTQNDPGAGGVVAMTLTSGGLTVNGTFVSASDRNVKQDFQPVDPQAVLAKVVALPLSEWRYKADEEHSRHLGPVAQDFHAAFGLGPDDKHIATVDADGVALAAIQGLNQKLEDENAQLKERLARLEQLVQQLIK